MPQAGQIIPSHLYPHTEVVVNDNTQLTQELATESDDSNKMLIAFSSQHSLNVVKQLFYFSACRPSIVTLIGWYDELYS